VHRDGKRNHNGFPFFILADDLKNCFFLPAAVAGTYDFYDTNNNSLASDLTSGIGMLWLAFNPLQQIGLHQASKGTCRV
jgi:hypothetical protein